MTGGQPHDGPLSVPEITRQVAAEGAKKVVVVTDEPDKYPVGTDFAHGVSIRHRDELDAVQRELRDIPGLTVLIYDQTCAAEKRRRRKRGTFPDPAKRVFINDAVCEGCGDCSEKSNCVSVKPLETELGRKRQIDQSNCNKDFSCVNGFCPSFVSVHGGTPAKAKRPQLEGRAATIRSPTADADRAAARRGLRHPGHRHRRHRRDHRRRADRHGGPSRRQGLHRARLHRPGAEERRGDEPCPARAQARGPARRAHRRRRRQPGARLRHGRGRLAGGAVAHRARRHPGGDQRLHARRSRPSCIERRHGSRRRGHDAVDPRRRGRRSRRRSSTAPGSPPRSSATPSPPTSSCWASPGRRAWSRCRSRRSSARSSSTASPSRPPSAPSPGAGSPRTTSPRCRRAAKPTLRSEKPVARTLPEIVAKRVELLDGLPGRGLRRALPRLRRQGRGGREGQGAGPHAASPRRSPSRSTS